MRPLPASLLTALMVAAPAAGSGVATLIPEAETPALYDDPAGGNANGDDPAIWLDPYDSARSVVIGTAKEGGLYVHGFGGRDLAIVSDRGRDRLAIYAISRGRLTDVTDPAAPFVFNATQEQVNEAETAYGLAAWKDAAGTYALVSRRHRTSVDLPASFTLPDGRSWTPCLEPGEQPQVEGMVVDQQRDVLYAAQEDVGIWRLRADLTGAPTLVDQSASTGCRARTTRRPTSARPAPTPATAAPTWPPTPRA
ncbi:phytase [Nonomuraea wenchangensis]|uniref:phytase n=1 Tax=Nonomuraea wenchangensis TaxID=568860 RepID=UPI003403A4D9